MILSSPTHLTELGPFFPHPRLDHLLLECCCSDYYRARPVRRASLVFLGDPCELCPGRRYDPRFQSRLPAPVRTERLPSAGIIGIISRPQWLAADLAIGRLSAEFRHQPGAGCGVPIIGQRMPSLAGRRLLGETDLWIMMSLSSVQGTPVARRPWPLRA
jgi:hypothetical protein